MNKSKFLKSAEISKKGLMMLVLLNPISSFVFFLFSRLSKIFGITVNLTAKTFWGQDIEGVISDPNFAFIYLLGFSDEGLTQILMTYLKPGMTAIDIGAHIGYETLLSSKIVGDEGRVFSFEPTPNTYSLLYKNICKIRNVIINNTAVWSKTTFLNFFDYGPAASGLNSFFKPRVSQELSRALKAETINVPAISLDDYITIYNIKPDFVKIDAESAEYDILIGMKGKIKSFKPIIVLEIGDMQSEIGKTRKCIKFLMNFGYKVLEYSEGNFREHKIKKNYLGIYDNLLFIPSK